MRPEPRHAFPATGRAFSPYPASDFREDGSAVRKVGMREDGERGGEWPAGPGRRAGAVGLGGGVRSVWFGRRDPGGGVRSVWFGRRDPGGGVRSVWFGRRAEAVGFGRCGSDGGPRRWGSVGVVRTAGSGSRVRTAAPETAEAEALPAPVPETAGAGALPAPVPLAVPAAPGPWPLVVGCGPSAGGCESSALPVAGRRTADGGDCGFRLPGHGPPAPGASGCRTPNPVRAPEHGAPVRAGPGCAAPYGNAACPPLPYGNAAHPRPVRERRPSPPCIGAELVRARRPRTGTRSSRGGRRGAPTRVRPAVSAAG